MQQGGGTSCVNFRLFIGNSNECHITFLKLSIDVTNCVKRSNIYRIGRIVSIKIM